MKWLRKRTVRSRLTALVVLTSTLLVIALSTILWINESRQSSRRLDRSLQRRVDAIDLSLRSKGRFPYTEPYGEAIDADYRILGMSQAIDLPGLLTQSQVDFVLRNGGLQFRREDRVLGGTTRFLAQRRLIDNFPVVVVVGETESVLEDSRNQLRLALAIGAPLLVLLTGVGGWSLAGAILRPVRKMTDDAAAISRFDAKARLASGSGNDELTHLGETLNSMLDRLESSYRRERSFVDDASHELRTPLAIVRGELELALLHPGNPPETREAIQRSIDEVDRMIALANDLLVSARSEATSEDGTQRSGTQSTAVRALLLSVRERFGNGDEVRFEEGEQVSNDTRVAMRADHLERVLLNLLENARRFAKSTVTISSRIADEMVHIEVSDDGPGFPVGFIDRAFDRFSVADQARTRRSGPDCVPDTGGGVGLGLAIVADLVGHAGGSVSAANRQREPRDATESSPAAAGARVTISLPLHRSN